MHDALSGIANAAYEKGLRVGFADADWMTDTDASTYVTLGGLGPDMCDSVEGKELHAVLLLRNPYNYHWAVTMMDLTNRTIVVFDSLLVLSDRDAFVKAQEAVDYYEAEAVGRGWCWPNRLEVKYLTF